MSYANASSATTSGTTSPSAPQPRAKSASDARDEAGKKLTEATFLTEQAANAKAAIAQTIDEIKAHLAHGVDPKALTRDYPWVAVGAAAIAGFTAATMIVPSREEQALKRLAALEKALHPQTSPPSPGAGTDSAAQYQAGHTSFWGGVARELFGAVKPALLSMLTAGIAGAAAKPDVEEIQAATGAGASIPPPGPTS
ncbi:MAG: hypothetical protein ACREIT_12280 [Tepidisphaeraceae bacterium]